jgi:CRISPR-associated protein Cmr1
MMPQRTSRRRAGVPPVTLRGAPTPIVEGTLRFLTPMFGGGVVLNQAAPHLKEHDALTPVRPAAVRGALREWWRRACGFADDGSPLPRDVLIARERALWGWATTTDVPGRGWVAVTVTSQPIPQPFPVYIDARRANAGMEGLAYGAFPLTPAQGAAVTSPGTLTHMTGTFGVRLTAHELSGTLKDAACKAWGDDPLPKMRAEVERAWLAWTTFGGLGGRTRRGFGAVAPATDAPPWQKVASTLEWSHRVIEGPTDEAATIALNLGLNRLRAFRQGVGVGRNPGQAPNRPGRSRWPEPDLIRRLTHRHANQHPPQHPVQKAPRAAFGLPIVFHFKDKGAGDPADVTLVPARGDRLASPIILRPVPSGGGYACVALVLPQRSPLAHELHALEFKGQHQRYPTSGLLTARELQEVRPLRESRPERGPDDVLSAFITFFRGKP